MVFLRLAEDRPVAPEVVLVGHPSTAQYLGHVSVNNRACFIEEAKRDCVTSTEGKSVGAVYINIVSVDDVWFYC